MQNVLVTLFPSYALHMSYGAVFKIYWSKIYCPAHVTSTQLNRELRTQVSDTEL